MIIKEQAKPIEVKEDREKFAKPDSPIFRAKYAQDRRKKRKKSNEEEA